MKIINNKEYVGDNNLEGLILINRIGSILNTHLQEEM